MNARVFRRRHPGERAFTLVELIVVVGVLAILATIVILNIVGVGGRGASAACQTDVKTIETAMTAYYNDQVPPGWNGQFPAAQYTNVGGADPYPVFDVLTPTYVHTHPGTACSTITIADVSGGGKIASTP